MPLWARPDKIHGVVSAPATHVIQITEDHGYPRSASEALAPLWQSWFQAGHYVNIICGETYRLQGLPEALAQVTEVRAEV